MPAHFAVECVLATVVENSAMENADMFGDDEVFGADAVPAPVPAPVPAHHQPGALWSGFVLHAHST